MARRSSALLLVLLGGFLAGVAGLALWVLNSSDGATEVQASAAGAPDQVPAPGAVPEMAGHGKDPEVGAVEAVAAERGSEPERPRTQRLDAEDAELAGAYWIEGRVIFPPDTPFGEQVEILARGKSFENRPLHRDEVKSDGSFRVAFAPETRTGWLVMEADYVYIDKPMRVKPKNPPESIELEAKLGGRIAGVVLAPPLSAEDHAALVGEEIELEGQDPVEFTDIGHKRKAELDEELAFAVGGLPPSLDYEVVLDSEVLTRAELDGLTIKPGETTEIELEATLGVRVSGLIRDVNGQPVKDVELHAFSHDEAREERRPRPREIDVADNGTFLARGVTPGEIALVASGEGYFGARVDLGERADGDVSENVQLTLGQGHFVRGRVDWPEGDGVTECTVALTQDFEEDDSVPFEVRSNYISKEDHEVETELDGTFEVTGLGPGPYEIEASAVRPDEKGRRRKKGPRWNATLEDVQADTEGLVITLGQGHSVSGRVVDDVGAPLDRFVIQAMPESDRTAFMIGGNWWFDSDEGLSRKFYDAGGVFTFEGFRPGHWRVRAVAEGYQDAEPVSVMLPEEGEGLELIVPRVAVLHGVVLDPSGNPMAGANVSAETAGGPVWMKMLDKHGTRTDEDGAFELDDAPTGRVVVRARGRGLAPSDDYKLDLQPGAVQTGIVLTLRTGGRITGQLLSTSGEPVADRKIEIDLGQWSFMDRATRTDDTGAFSYEHLPPGTYRVSATMSDEERRAMQDSDKDDWAARWAAQKHATAVIEGDETVHVVLGAPPENAVHVTGTVSRSGEPVDGAQVWASPIGSGQRDGQTRAASSAADGSYELVLDAPGEYSFTVSGENQARRSHTESIPDTGEVRVDLALPSGLLAGRVVGPDGDPLDEVPVMLQTSTATAETRDFGVSGWEQTDDEGNFRFEGVAEGEYVLTAGHSLWSRSDEAEYGTAVAEVRLDEDEERDDLVLIVERSATITGTVRGTDGRPVSGASIFVRNESGALLAQWSMVLTDGAGKFRRAGLNSGSWTLSARRGTTASAESRPVRVSSGGTAEVDLELVASTMLIVHTEDAEGNPVGSSLSVTDEAGREFRTMQSFVDQGLAEEYQEGISRVAGPLPPGEYRVVVSNHDGVTAEETVRLRGQERETVRLRLAGEE
jgi:hypothetical protein